MIRSRKRRGSNAIEFALCLPIWFAVVVAIIDFGWLFFYQTTLDAATNLGCRAGSLVDPGKVDQHIDLVKTAALDKMQVTLGGDACVSPNCTIDAYTMGAPPLRSLRCEAHLKVTPLVGLFVSTRYLASRQVSRLEWQREAAPL